MKKNTMIEIGSITDLDGNCFDAYAEHLTFTGRGEDLDVVVEHIELVPTSGELLETIVAPSLSEMPDRFSQRQVAALESWVLEQQRISHQAYLQDLYTDSQRSFE